MSATYVAHEGDDSDCVYFLLAGRISVRLPVEGTRHRPQARGVRTGGFGRRARVARRVATVGRPRRRTTGAGRVASRCATSTISMPSSRDSRRRSTPTSPTRSRNGCAAPTAASARSSSRRRRARQADATSTRSPTGEVGSDVSTRVKPGVARERAERVGLVRRVLTHEDCRRRAATRGASRTMVSRHSSPDGPLTSARAGSYAATSVGQLGVLRLRHVGRVRHHEAQLAAQLERQRVEPVAVHEPRPASRAKPMLDRLARATASASSLASVAHTAASGSSVTSASASAPDPVPRSAIEYSVMPADHGSALPRARAARARARRSRPGRRPRSRDAGSGPGDRP